MSFSWTFGKLINLKYAYLSEQSRVLLRRRRLRTKRSIVGSRDLKVGLYLTVGSRDLKVGLYLTVGLRDLKVGLYLTVGSRDLKVGLYLTVGSRDLNVGLYLTEEILR